MWKSDSEMGMEPKSTQMEASIKVNGKKPYKWYGKNYIALGFYEGEWVEGAKHGKGMYI